MIRNDTKRKTAQTTRHLLITLFVLLIICFLPVATPASDSQESLWESVSSGTAVVLMRHAIAPGTGDPGNFTIGKCATQRNLSEDGRRQARAIGDRFRENGIAAARVYSSQWCRCLETGELLGLGPVNELTVLNSFFQNFERRDSQTAGLSNWIATQTLDQPLVLVTHQVNITALTQIFPQSGEMVVVGRSASGELTVLGSIETD